MERRYAIPDTKELQWTATPSEEQLLGAPLFASGSRPSISFQPLPPHDWAAADVDVQLEPPTGSRRWRPQARDLIAVSAVAAAVWFGLRGPDGLPFRSVEAATPTTANAVAAHVLTDRGELFSLPREAAAAPDRAAVGRAHRGEHGSRGGKGGDPPAKSKDPKAPLVQATIPGVGSVTVEQPSIPDTGLPVPGLPDLPETEVAVPGTATVSLP